MSRVGFVEAEGHRIDSRYVKVKRVLHDYTESSQSRSHMESSDGELMVVLDLGVDDYLDRVGMSREIVRVFQVLKKKTGICPSSLSSLHCLALVM